MITCLAGRLQLREELTLVIVSSAGGTRGTLMLFFHWEIKTTTASAKLFLSKLAELMCAVKEPSTPRPAATARFWTL